MTDLPRPILTGVLAVGILAGVAGCGAQHTDTAMSSSTITPTTPATSRTLDPEDCVAQTPQGTIDRGAHNLSFGKGFLRVAIGPTDTTTPAPTGTPAQGITCYEFAKWGPVRPDVPPDSLLFVFKGAGIDGAQIEFLVGELTGGVLPPIGTVRPRVGPLTGPINAQVGVSAEGTYHHSPVCALTITAMSAERAAGSFSCPSAALTDANPLAPDDDVSYDADESSTVPPPPGAPAVPPAVSLTGWFDLRP